jgi:hypothetical protein
VDGILVGAGKAGAQTRQNLAMNEIAHHTFGRMRDEEGF